MVRYLGCTWGGIPKQLRPGDLTWKISSSVALQLENILLPDTSYLINEPDLKIGVPTVVIR